MRLNGLLGGVKPGLRSCMSEARGDARTFSITLHTRSSSRWRRSSKVMNGHSASMCVYLRQGSHKKLKQGRVIALLS